MTLLVRTDFADSRAWQGLCEAVRTPSVEGFLAAVEFVDDPAFRDLAAEQVVERLPEGGYRRLVAVADATTLGSAEFPIVVIDVLRCPPRSLRVIASQLWSVENNLSLGNMDYEEFAGSVGADGVFRGF
jgi:hypothetical protein